MGVTAMQHPFVGIPTELVTGCVQLMVSLNMVGMTRLQMPFQNDRDGPKIIAECLDYAEVQL